jgi:peptide/nickel transport system permease protein
MKMVSSKQIVEKFRDYKRSLLHSWNLFRESRIGLLGLAIMIAFTVMAVAAPFMGLKHPVEWTAPSLDLLEADPYFVNPPNVTGLVTHEMGVRIVQRVQGETNAAEDNMDRIYVGEGSELTAYSYTGFRRWQLDLTDDVSTGVRVDNFGSQDDPTGEQHYVLVGCADGRLYSIRDDIYERDQTASKTEEPTSSEIYSQVLDSEITSNIGVFNIVHRDTATATYDYFSYDRVFVGTDSGTVYGLGIFMNTTWSVQVDNSTINSVAVADRQGIVVASTTDGKLYGMRMSDGQPVWAVPYDIGVDISPVAINNDGSWIVVGASNGRLHIVDTLLGTSLTGWEDGFPLSKTAGELDNGFLSTPTLNNDASTIYVTSSSGYAYAIRSGSKTIQWVYDANHGLDNAAQFISPATYDRLTLSIFVVDNNFNGTPGDPTNDYSTIYRIGEDGIVNLNMTFPGVAKLSPITCYVRQHGFVRGLVFAISHPEDAAETTGITTLYSYSAAGVYLAPLKPTWLLPADQKPKSGNEYWLGTDAQGRDILSQVIWGSRVALLVGFAAAAFSIGIGVVVGLVAGYYGGWVDIVLMRFTDVILVLPSLPLLIILAALLQPSIWNIVFIIGIVGWGGPARVIRSAVLSLKERPFIDSARVTGASKMRIMFKHIAPNVLPLGLLYMTFYVGGAILSEAALAFIGLGDPRTMSWGMMLNFVQHSNALSNWWWLIPPGLCITLVVMAFFLMGRAFDEIVNPRLRKR